MKIDLGQVLIMPNGKQYNNEPVMGADGKQEMNEDGSPKFTPMRLGDMCLIGLTTPQEGIQGPEKLARYKLGQRILAADGGEIQLKSQDVSKLKDCINLATPLPFVYGQCCEMLDPAEVEDDTPEPETPEA